MDLLWTKTRKRPITCTAGMLENNLNYIIIWFGNHPGLGVNSLLIFLCVKEKKPYVKVFRNIDFLPVKIKIHAWKNPKMCPWNILTAREKLQKSVRESDFLCVKNIKKRPKIRFTHTFDFHGKKNAINCYQNAWKMKSSA